MGSGGSGGNSHFARSNTSDSPQSQQSSSRISSQAADSGEFPPLNYPHQVVDSSYSPHMPNIWNDGQGFQAMNYASSPGSNFSPSSIPLGPTTLPGGPTSSASSYHPQMSHSSSYSSSASSNPRARLDEPDRRFERPRPRGNVELFNPKGKKNAAAAGNQSGNNSDTGSNRRGPTSSKSISSSNGASCSNLSVDAERTRGEAVRTSILAEKIDNLSLGDQTSEKDGPSRH